MRARGFGMAVTAAAVLVVGGAAAAHADERVSIRVPFDFIVGDTSMPAGTYRVGEVQNNAGLVAIESADGKHFATTMTIPAQARGQFAPELKFAKYDNQYFLSRVVTGDEESRQVVLTPAKMQHEIDAVAAAR